MTLRPALRHRLRQGEQAQGIQEKVKIIKNISIKKCVELKIYGDVQGVSFRAQVYEIAKSLGLVGSVKNETDGTVKIIVEGGEKELKNLIERCYTIPSAKVEKIDVEWREAMEEFEGFEIKY